MSATTPHAPKAGGMSTGRKALWAIGALWLGGIIFFVAIVGFGSDKAASVASGVYSPTDEFKLDTWFSVGPVDFNKGVLYLILAALITIGVLLYAAHRLKARPGRLQVAIEMFYDLISSMADGSMDKSMSRKYFPLIATIFVFILVSNLIGYIPLPIDTGQKFLLFGIHWPSFQIYASDTNVAFPLVLALMVFVLFTYEGFRAHGFIGFFKSLLPPGLHGPMAAGIFVIETAVVLPAADLADRPALGQPAGRPPADRVHGRRARRTRPATRSSPGRCCRSASRSSCSRRC